MTIKNYDRKIERFRIEAKKLGASLKTINHYSNKLHRLLPDLTASSGDYLCKKFLSHIASTLGVHYEA